MAFQAKQFIKHLSARPGIYQMMDEKGDVLYVGKAKDLKKRVASYFVRTKKDSKTESLVKLITDINVIVTDTENEALLLESVLIKQLKPRFNILLRDDKSYPFLYLSPHSDFPRLDFYRGPKKGKGKYFGPYPNAGAVRETLTLLQRLFKLRQCSDIFFKHRTRPCLQYQIKRCTAPCVGFITPEEYQINVRLAVLFLQGKNQAIVNELAAEMDAASKQLAYEKAAHLRDLIATLRQVQDRQNIINMGKTNDIDVIAVSSASNIVCVQVLFIRQGRLLGNKCFFPKTPGGTSDEEVLTAFIPQYYTNEQNRDLIPNAVIVNIKLHERHWIEAALSEKLATKMQIIDQPRGQRKQWLRIASANARHALSMRLSERSNMALRFEKLQSSLRLANCPERVECFDVSHTSGEAAVCSCVVFNQEGPVKSDYRRYNIKGITPGDDYAALKQTLSRRYTKVKAAGAKLPDMIMIDGGKGQLAQAEQVLEELQVSGVILLGVAKGRSRRPGLEQLFLSSRDAPMRLPSDSLALHLIQQIRDEAHRFAITGHKTRRDKARKRSKLEDIPGIGAKRRRELLRQFGGLEPIKKASINEIAKVPGISMDLAKRIYEALH